MTAVTYVMTIVGDPTGGTFTAAVVNGTTGDGTYSAGIAPTATATQVQTALAALPNVGAGNVTVLGNAGGPWTITLAGGGYIQPSPVGLTPSGSVWVTNPDGSMTWPGLVNIPGDINPLGNGIGFLTLTPSGGVSNLPVLAQGEPGLPPSMTFAATQLAAGSAPTVTATQTSAGGPGQASAYSVTIGVPIGQTGAAGTNAYVSTAGDVEGTPADGDQLIYSGADSKWKIQPAWVPSLYSCQSFTAQPSTTTTSATIATIGIPAQPFAWRPNACGSVQVTGTANTHLDLAILLGSPTGQQVAYAQGVTGAITQTLTATRAFGGAISGTSTYGQVGAGATATLYLVVLQTASTTDAWSASAAHASLEIECIPIP